MRPWRYASIQTKIVGVSLSLLIGASILLSLFWHQRAQANAEKYLQAMADNYTQQANSSLNYILTDTFHMLTLITLNEESIIGPIQAIDHMELDQNSQFDMRYLENQRKIMDFLRTMNGYKYYIVGIQVFSALGHPFQTSALFRDNRALFSDIKAMDAKTLTTTMVMMEPMKVEGTWTKLHSDYVIPAVRAILDTRHDIIGYALLFFDYSLFERMFSDNLPSGSQCKITDSKGRIVFSNEADGTSFPPSPSQNIIQSSPLDNVDWKLEIAVPTQSIMEPIDRTLRITVFWILCIILIAAVAMILILSSITRRISQLNTAMERIGDGKFIPLGEPKEHDEIASMQRTFNSMLREITRLMREQTDAEREKAEQQFKLLQAQINPHFISNTLNAISWMAKKQHADNIVPLADSMNSLLRSVLKNDQRLIPLREELGQVKNYLDIMLCSGAYDFTLDIDVPEALQELLVLKFILQPIVENSLFHGFATQNLMRDQRLLISARRNGDDLDLFVRDNGMGLTEEEIKTMGQGKPNKHDGLSGVGTANVQKRILLEYGDGYGLSYSSKLGSYTEARLHVKVVHG